MSESFNDMHADMNDKLLIYLYLDDVPNGYCYVLHRKAFMFIYIIN